MSGGTPITIEVSVGYPKARRSTMLYCRDALCQLDSDDYSKILITRLGEKQTTVVEVDDDMPLLAELRAFANYLQGGPAPMTPLGEEIEIIEIITQIERAASRP